MEKDTHSLLNGILTICFYNGYEEFIVDLIEFLEENIVSKKETMIYFEDFKNGKYKWKFYGGDYHNSAIHIIQMLLINEYGDYGTSPRFGWINEDSYERLLNDLKYEIHEHWEAKKWDEEERVFKPSGEHAFKRKLPIDK